MSTPAQPPSTARSLGALYDSLTALREEAISLFAQYENDETAGDMAAVARDIGSRAFRIENALATINEGLNQL